MSKLEELLGKYGVEVNPCIEDLNLENATKVIDFKIADFEDFVYVYSSICEELKYRDGVLGLDVGGFFIFDPRDGEVDALYEVVCMAAFKLYKLWQGVIYFKRLES